MKITWLGHSTVLVELDGVRLLTDPVLRARVLHLRRSPSATTVSPGHIDAVLVSHGHYDHFDLPSLARLEGRPTVVVPLGLGALLRRRGFSTVREVTAGDAVELSGVPVRATFAHHRAARRSLTRKAAALGYVLDGSRRVYFAGDTGLFDGMAELAPLDLALLPVSGWGSRLPAGHLDPHAAAVALGLLRPRVAVPIHWGTLSPFRPRAHTRTPAEAFARAAAELAPDVEVRILGVNESLEL